MLWKIRLVQQIQTAPSRLPALDLLRLAAVAGGGSRIAQVAPRLQ
ncbi:hypothetical protein [Nitrobacter vulgaris]|nr:hypothetical protein [Nitrobacter vulgaris]